jgi:arylsulfatase A-like enzyme
MKYALFAVALVVCQSAVGLAEESARPNVVFILADDLGWADTTLYGHTKFYNTPNLERLAKRGMTFTHAYSASPLCSPTRSAILTGLSPARTGITTPNCHLPQVVLKATPGVSAHGSAKSVQPEPVTRLKTDYLTLTKSLKAAGYATGHFGKWHLGHEPYSPREHGFDVDVPHHPGPGPAGSYVAPWKFKDFDHDPDVPHQHIEDRMAKEATAWIEQHQHEPFFLNYWMFSVHAPFDAKRDLIEQYRARVNPQDPQHSPTYAAMVESMDDAVGALLDTLDRLKLAGNTIIVFASDNGGNMYSEVDGTMPTSNTPLRGGKATMFEGGTRVPCVVCWSGVVAPNSQSDVLLQSEDYYPTLLDALAISPAKDQQFDGISILPVLKGEEIHERPLFQYFPHSPPVPDWLPPSVSVHRGDWKLIRIFHGGENEAHRYLLYDLRADISETNNLADAKPELVRELDALIEDFLNRTQAVRPIPNPKFDPALYRPEEIGKPKVRNQRPAPKTASDRNDPGAVPGLKGWKARGCNVRIVDGIATVQAASDAPFWGVAPGALNGEAKLRVRLRGGDGEGWIEWLPGGDAKSARKSEAFTAEAETWTERELKIPAQRGESGILRLHLPAQKKAVAIDWIEVDTPKGKQRWEF